MTSVKPGRSNYELHERKRIHTNFVCVVIDPDFCLSGPLFCQTRVTEGEGLVVLAPEQSTEAHVQRDHPLAPALKEGGERICGTCRTGSYSDRLTLAIDVSTTLSSPWALDFLSRIR